MTHSDLANVCKYVFLYKHYFHPGQLTEKIINWKYVIYVYATGSAYVEELYKLCLRILITPKIRNSIEFHIKIINI